MRHCQFIPSIFFFSRRKLETLFLEDSAIDDHDSDWLRALAANNTALVTLNFYLTDLAFSPPDLELLANNCRSLTTLKISDCDISDLVGLFRAAAALRDFGGGSLDDDRGTALNKYNDFYFPPSLQSLNLVFMGSNEMHIIFPYAAALRKLDLQYTLLGTEDHCQLISRCPNLLVLEVYSLSLFSTYCMVWYALSESWISCTPSIFNIHSCVQSQTNLTQLDLFC